MFALFEILGFCIAFAAALVLRRRHVDVLLRMAVWGTKLTLAVVFIIGTIGIPLFLHRFERADFSNDRVTTISQLHHDMAHGFITLFVLFWPFLFTASITRSSGAFRTFALGLASLLTFVLFLFVSFTGYALPEGMPRTLQEREIFHAVRFVVLHVAASPLLACTSLALLGWRNARALKRTDRQRIILPP